ncbi:MAG: hypothetical protein ACRDPA_18970 [Solirubrobacteraceae bacterium]
MLRYHDREVAPVADRSGRAADLVADLNRVEAGLSAVRDFDESVVETTDAREGLLTKHVGRSVGTTTSGIEVDQRQPWRSTPRLALRDSIERALSFSPASTVRGREPLSRRDRLDHFFRARSRSRRSTQKFVYLRRSPCHPAVAVSPHMWGSVNVRLQSDVSEAEPAGRRRAL